MRSFKRTIPSTIALGAAVSLAGACGSDTDEGDATLEIVGSDARALDHGDTEELEVRYLEDGEPLEGQVEFAIEGESQGASLSENVADTNIEGEASVFLNADNEDEANFEVVASAPDAADATWTISIEAPLGPGDPDGTYRVESDFNIVPGLEGTAGSVIGGIVEFGDEPGEAILRLALEYVEALGIDGLNPDDIDPATFGPVITAALEEHAGDFVADLIEIGGHFSEMTQNFGLITELEVSGGGANHEITDVQFQLDGVVETESLSQVGVDVGAAEDVNFEVDEEDGTVTIEIHDLPTNYGQMILFGLEDVILPQIDDSFAGGIDDFVDGALDGQCENIANFVAGDEDGDSTMADVIETVCDYGISLVVGYARGQIEDFGDEEEDISLSLEGTGVAQDLNGDGQTDEITGSWEATFEVGGSTVTFVSEDDSSFLAERD